MISLTGLIGPLECRITGPAQDRTVSQLDYDSRLARSGSLFFCLRGARADGHEYAPQAYANGARAFVTDHVLPLPDDAVQVVVDNTRKALAVLSAAFYGHSADRLTLIGITGTKGKTTTAILIQELLSKNGIRCGYIGTNGVMFDGRRYDTLNSTPESRELHRYFAMMLEAGVTHVAMEVSSQALDHDRVTGLKFDTAVFTNLSRDHIGAGEHASFEEYRDAKRKLFTDHGAARIVYNADDPFSGYMIGASGAELISFGTSPGADYLGTDLRPFRDGSVLGIEYDVVTGGQKTAMRVRQPGEFSVYNGLAATAVAASCGIGVRQVAEVIGGVSVGGRFEIVEAVDGVTFVIDYAHNGISLSRALSVLREYGPDRLICVFGCVGGRTFDRRKEMGTTASSLADLSILTSDNPDFEEPEKIIQETLNWFDQSKPHLIIPDREEAVRTAVRIARPGDIVLFAGKGHETYQLIRGEKVPFSEKEILLDEAARRKEETAACGRSE